MRTMMAGLLLLASGPAAAQVAPAGKPKAVPDADRMVCHREEVTGSLAGGRKTCHTRAEWEALARASQATAERMMDQGRINSCGATTAGGC